jgi:hypothetical protein
MQTVNRPAGVLVIAIFHFIFGGVGLLCNLCGAGGQAINANKSFGSKGNAEEERIERDAEAVLNRKAPGYHAVEVGDIVVSLLANGVLIAAGVGLLLLKPWARITSISWAALILLVKVFVAGYYILVVFPALSAAFREALGDVPAQQRQAAESVITFLKGALIASPCLVSIYAVVVLIVMLLPGVSAAFSGAAMAGGGLEDYHDRYRTGGQYGQYPPGDYPGGLPDDPFRR